ncbi:MAG: FG-GAP repeat domain-containing protein, partial [Gammaproteobacteria bacterium]
MVLRALCGLLLCAALVWCDTAGLFEDATVKSGLAFRHDNSKTGRKYLPETMSGGVAIFDFDNDEAMDVFFVNGARLTVPQSDTAEPEKSDARYWNRLYRNRGDGAFADVTEQSGVQGRGYGMGVAAADYNNDGYTDLLVTTAGAKGRSSVILYRNDQGKRFVDATAGAGLQVEGWATSAGFFDYDRDGDLDLFVCRYVKFSYAEDRRCGLNTAAGRSYCHPD